LGLKYLWYGRGGNTTGLHYDTSENFFMQLYGQKRWLISEPNSFLNLHPRSALSNYPKITDFNPLKPDFDKFPKAQKVKFYDLTMDAGSILYVPAYWWHQVISYSTIISVNIWCKTSIFKAEWGALQLIPLYMRNLMGFNIFPKRF
jgi:ribosomal protein L16 Arg81 hydroxylase